MWPSLPRFGFGGKLSGRRLWQRRCPSRARRLQAQPILSNDYSSPASSSAHRSAVAFCLRANHFQMRLATPWALQLEDELPGLDFIHEIRQSPVTSGASHLRLENARHSVTVESRSGRIQSIEGWICLYRSIEMTKPSSRRGRFRKTK